MSSLDAITSFHNAFRRDVAAIDQAALAVARGDDEQRTTFERYRFFNEALVWHANGEEAVIFPALETVVPDVAEAYARDHRRLDVAYEALESAAAADDALRMARASAALKFHLETHLAKEDAHLYRLVRERVPVSEQDKAVGLLAASVPRERFPEVIAWLFPLLGDVDRERLLHVWRELMPPPVLAGVIPLVQQAVGPDWTNLAQRTGF
jgi:hemerythrin-like domain-containing protein